MATKYEYRVSNGSDPITVIDKYGNARGIGTSGTTYFVDGNSGNDANNGFSWDKAFKTLAFAFATSNTDIARGSDRWARRNRIYIAGDDFVEDLVALPQKTDIVGVGSSDNYPMAAIRGNHDPINNAVGCRFFNVRFRPAASADLITLLSTSGGGIEFHGCIFDANYSTFTAPSAIDTTASQYLKVIGSEFLGAFSSDYIDIGAGAINGMEIAYNEMKGGADNGIMVTGTGTIVQGRRGSIHHNFIECADIFIDVNSTSVFNVHDNTCISGEALGSGSYVIDLTFASNNIVTGNDVSASIPVIPAT